MQGDHCGDFTDMVGIQTPRGSGERTENMEGQIELLDYLKSLEKDGFDILDYIPTGHANAVTRAYLCSVTGLDDRLYGMPYHRRVVKCRS